MFIGDLNQIQNVIEWMEKLLILSQKTSSQIYDEAYSDKGTVY